MKPLRLGLLGAGRMGRLHARVYSELSDVDLVGIVDIDPAHAQALAEKYQTQVFPNIEDLADQVQAVSIATPTNTHLQVARHFLQQGIPTLIEKPLAQDSEQARQILALAQGHHTFVQVGHSERFNPAVRTLASYTIRPRFIEAVRVSPFPFRSMDIGAVMDMMIHDIDLVLHLVGSVPVSVQATGLAVLGQHEDLADARLTFADGCVAKLTCSRLALSTRRTLKIFSNEQYFSLDLHKKTGLLIDKSLNAPTVKDTLAKVADGRLRASAVKWTDLVKPQPLTIENAEPIRLELENFVQSVGNSAQPIVSGADGLAAITTAEAIIKKIKADLSKR